MVSSFADLLIQTSKEAGLSETEVTEEAVIATRSPPAPMDVITHTPEARLRIPFFKSSDNFFSDILLP